MRQLTKFSRVGKLVPNWFKLQSLRGYIASNKRANARPAAVCKTGSMTFQNLFILKNLVLTVVDARNLHGNDPVWGGHSCIDCLLSMRILLPRTNTREYNPTSFVIFCRGNLLRAKL